MMPETDTKRTQLLDRLRAFESCVVAFSGGVDSAVVAKAAYLALQDRAVAVMGISPSVPESERRLAHEVAHSIGIRHQEVDTREFQSVDYTRNAHDRCFHCKTELYAQLRQFATNHGYAAIVNGANLDDQHDYRPGQRAADAADVCSPLAECGFCKSDVRALASYWQLPVWNKPATPCLASRVAYGQEVTPERLQMIHVVEQYLRSRGLDNVRVRYHEGDLARIEVPLSSVSALAQESLRIELVQQARQAGFRFVTVDLEGFRSGSLNQLVQLEPTPNPTNHARKAATS